MVLWFALVMVAALIALQIWQAVRINRMKKQPVVAENRFHDVDGVKVADSYYFHPFHLWIKKEGVDKVRIGLDDFARRMIGKVEDVILPVANTKVTAGQSCCRFDNGKSVVAMVAPVTGEIEEVNVALMNDPASISDDPYEKGWLYTVKGWNLSSQLQSLMKGESVDNWMQSAVQRLKSGSGDYDAATAQDGGHLIDDFHVQLDKYEWTMALREHMGTEPMRKHNSN